MACRIPFDDGDRRTDDFNAAVRVQRIRLGIRVFLLDEYGGGDFLFVFPDVEGSRSLREGRPPPHTIPGTRRRRFRYDFNCFIPLLTFPANSAGKKFLQLF